MMLSSFRFRILNIVIALTFVVSQPVLGEENNMTVINEVERLISFVRTSGCQFNRNGRWYDSEEAAKHIGKKYRYVKKRGLVKTTDDFIKYAATKSSMSGNAYMVQCPDRQSITCSKWLITELDRYRGQQ